MSVVSPGTVPPATPEQHGAKAHSDGGWDANGGAFVPIQTRSGRFTSVDHHAFPAVTGMEIDWKLTPVALVKPLIDDELDGSAYETSTAEIAAQPADGGTVEWIARDDARIGSAGAPEDRASANAWSTFEQALAITISGEERVAVALDRSTLDAAPRGAHTVITAKAHSHGHVVIRSTGQATLAENVEIVVEDGATLTLPTNAESSSSTTALPG